jgi:hypothetical protein
VLNRSSAVKWVLLIAAVEAAATGLVLIVSPPLFGRLIFGAELSEAGQALGRLTGIALGGVGDGGRRDESGLDDGR